MCLFWASNAKIGVGFQIHYLVCGATFVRPALQLDLERLAGFHLVTWSVLLQKTEIRGTAHRATIIVGQALDRHLDLCLI
jgi:hypothetical protein